MHNHFLGRRLQPSRNVKPKAGHPAVPFSSAGLVMFAFGNRMQKTRNGKGRPYCQRLLWEAHVFEQVLKTRIFAERVKSRIGLYQRHFVRAFSQAFV